MSDRLSTYLEKVSVLFPDVTWGEAELITHGWANDVVVLDKSLVFRFPKTKEARDRLPRMVRLLRYLAPRLTVAIPSYSYVSPDASFVGYERLPGEPLWEDECLPESELADFLTELHASPTQTARGFGVEDDAQAGSLNFETLAKAAQSKMTELGASELRQRIASFADELEQAGRHTSHVLLHGDLTPPHILSDGGRTISGIIDFDGARIGDPALDFQGIWAYGPRAVAGVYRAYRGPKDDDFLRRSLCYRVRSGLTTWYVNDRRGASEDFLRQREREVGRWLQEEPYHWINQALG